MFSYLKNDGSPQCSAGIYTIYEKTLQGVVVLLYIDIAHHLIFIVE